MGFIPTHGPTCKKVNSYPTKCKECDEPVVYCECTCGSKMWFDANEDHEHECGRVTLKMREERAGLLISLIAQAERNAKGETQCPMCGVMVKNAGGKAKRHFEKCPKLATFLPRPEQWGGY